MSISVAQAVAFARLAGFSGEPLVTVVAIAKAESGLEPGAQGWNGPTDGCPGGSVDRGLLQINSCYWRQLPDSLVYDPAGAFQAGWTVSQGGATFTPWSTYTGGHYLAHVDEVRAAVGNAPSGDPGGGGNTGGGGGAVVGDVGDGYQVNWKLILAAIALIVLAGD